jgi:hypothetical protein
MKKSKRKYFIIPAAIIVVLFLLALFLVPKAPMTGEVVSVVTPDYVELRWVNNNILSQKVGIASECITTVSENAPNEEPVTGCNWQYQELEAGATSFKDYDIEPTLKFYQIESKVQVGEGSCAPECRTSCGTLQALTWVDPCTGECLTGCSVVGDKAYCCLIDSDSQGWYDAPCDTIKGNTYEHLIKYDGSCQYSAQVCDQKSDILVKFTQELEMPMARNLEGTSINWLTATKDIIIVPGQPMESATELLKSDVVDYVTYWNPAHQAYYGAAFGTEPLGMQVITGPFNLEQYHPYFVGAKTNAKITWAGPLPTWETFELKFVEKYLGETKESINFIVIPFDTSLKKAADICTELNLPGNAVIGAWDPVTQNYINDGSRSRCAIITGPGQGTPFNFDLNPGQAYEVAGLEHDITWKQE